MLGVRVVGSGFMVLGLRGLGVHRACILLYSVGFRSTSVAFLALDTTKSRSDVGTLRTTQLKPLSVLLALPVCLQWPHKDSENAIGKVIRVSCLPVGSGCYGR